MSLPSSGGMSKFALCGFFYPHDGIVFTQTSLRLPYVMDRSKLFPGLYCSFLLVSGILSTPEWPIDPTPTLADHLKYCRSISDHNKQISSAINSPRKRLGPNTHGSRNHHVPVLIPHNTAVVYNTGSRTTSTSINIRALV